VPISDAMQMTVSSDIENRIDDSNSTADRMLCDPMRGRRPCVETDIEKNACAR
jgi:hypothetical protein